MSVSHDRRRALLVVVVVLVAGLFAACGDSDDETTTGTRSAPPDTEGPPTTRTSQHETECTDEFPQVLDVYTDDPTEEPYLDDVGACTNADGTATLVINESDAAWKLTSDPPASVTQLDNDAEHSVYRAAVGLTYQAAILAPRSTVIVDAAPATVQWDIALGFSAMWLLHDQMYQPLAKFGREQVEDLFVNGSPRRRALLTCGQAAYDIVGSDLSGLTSSDPVQELLSGVGLASSVTGCARAWQEADRAEMVRFGETVTWEEVGQVAREESFLSRADDTLSSLKRVGTELLVLFKAFRRP